MRRVLPILLLLVPHAQRPARAHDIPNAQVDRSIQVILGSDRLAIDYEVSLSELTLTQDLRALDGTLPSGDRDDWLRRYGEVVGVLNARGLLVSVDGRPIELEVRGFDLDVEEHPRYTFHFEAPLPSEGRLAIQDTNYVASLGTSRLAVRRLPGVTTRGDLGPEDVDDVPIRPVWQLDDIEERRTRQVAFDYGPTIAAGSDTGVVTSPPETSSPTTAKARPSGPGSGRLTRLLDRASAGSILGLLAVALGLGAAHALQPGHGKTLVAAAAVGDRGGWPRASALALIVTFAHMAGVLAVALALWITRSTRYGEINAALAHLAGFAIAAIGLWRLGRHLGGHGEHDRSHLGAPDDLEPRSLIGLGLAGGLVPCWDAVVLIVLAEAIGRLPLGLALLLAFSLGMAGVLVAVGVVAARVRRLAIGADREGTWERRLGIVGASALTLIGLSLLLV